MRKLRKVWGLWQGQEGSAVSEYALILVLVVIVLIGTLTQLGSTLQGKLQDIIRAVQGT